ncbi:hypothetical protein [Furfurilactobacillus siliginis]|uniref:Uncharacterized protein n=1 Tax=Furfurilactobacillus siliginis TaxID=348151 RepID=A0A0R2L0J6_9LACO|nr:hypothetical protein [Furfurilactobacillus siliginis]KRN95304.1 hypothetical protein IV55_GL000291 [Furfurilactobacillus siliginis]GEK28298.1 hypothetical protein LSI01_06090 [Furfurilactobacillus siliginis]
MNEDYGQKLQDMHDGKLAELTVKPDQFMAFQQALIKVTYRQRIVGMADRGGVITYHYEQD